MDDHSPAGQTLTYPPQMPILPLHLQAYAPSFWMLALGGASILGCILMRMYAPRINKPFIGRIE